MDTCVFLMFPYLLPGLLIEGLGKPCKATTRQLLYQLDMPEISNPKGL